MSEKDNTTSTISSFINEHLVKVLWGISLYFITNLSQDFKDVKITLQQILVNQATIEVRMSNKDAIDKKQDDDIQKLLDESRKK